jgi:flagellin-like hook-associated protein FlgL
MANLTNPVTDVARFAMKNSSRKIGLAGEQIATGKRGPSDIVDYVIGSKLRNNADVLSSVSKGVNYGINMLKNAQSVLESAKSGLLELKKIIAQANTAQGDTLTQLSDLYRAGEVNIQRLFDNANYDGRVLFNHVAALNIDIRVGENVANTIRASLPDLQMGTTFLTGLAVGAANSHILTASGGGGAWQDIAAAIRPAGGARTPAQNQSTADAFVNSLLTTVTNSISAIGGQLANFVQAGDDVNTSIKVQNEAADSYLNTNYEEASRDFKNALLAMRGSISITTQGYRVAEAALNLIEG